VDPQQDAKMSAVDRESSSRRWPLIYAGVAAFGTLVIVLLFLFSRHFSG